MDRYRKSAQNRDKAKQLSRDWGVSANQVRYRETGDWYAPLTRFPAALFDAEGYIFIANEQELHASPSIHIGKQISIPGGISAMPSYVHVQTRYSAVFHTDELSESQAFWEGAARHIMVNRYERDSEARSACISHYGAFCRVCDFDFSVRFGPLGSGFIHVHHVRPMSEIREGYSVNPITDLIPVCPNCHAMLHQRTPPLTIVELKALIADNKG